MPKKRGECVICGKVFDYYAPADKERQLCSQPCFREWQKTKPIVKSCARCGNEFRTGWAKKRFCSELCEKTYRHHKKTINTNEACSLCPRTPHEIKFASSSVCINCRAMAWRNGQCDKKAGRAGRCRQPYRKRGLGKGAPRFCPTHDAPEIWKWRSDLVAFLLVCNETGMMRKVFRKGTNTVVMPHWRGHAHIMSGTREVILLVERKDFCEGSVHWALAGRGSRSKKDPEGLLDAYPSALLKVDDMQVSAQLALRGNLQAIFECGNPVGKRAFTARLGLDEKAGGRRWLRFRKRLVEIGVPHEVVEGEIQSFEQVIRYDPRQWGNLLLFLDQRELQRQEGWTWM